MQPACSRKSQPISLTYPGLAREHSLDRLQVICDPRATESLPLVHRVRDMKHLFIFFPWLLSDCCLLALVSMPDLFLPEWNVLFNIKWTVLIGWVCGNISVWDWYKPTKTTFFFVFFLLAIKPKKKKSIYMVSVLTSAAEELSRIMPLFNLKINVKCEAMWFYD